MNIAARQASFGVFILFCALFSPNILAQDLIASSQAVSNKSDEETSKEFLEESKTLELIDLPLEELLNIKVNTSSKMLEDIYDAPGIISVITKSEIETFGGATLADVLDRATSQFYGPQVEFSSMSQPYIRGRNSFQILCMVNGHPIRNRLMGSCWPPYFNTFPLTRIDHIEVIRGPGSVLYGTGAVTGVINIITKVPLKSAAELGARYGNFNNDNIFGDADITFWEDGKASVGLLHIDDRGWPFSMSDVNGLYSSTKMWTRSNGFTLNAQKADFSFDGWYGSKKNFAIIGWPGAVIWPGTEDDQADGFFNVGWKHQWTKNSITSANFTYEGFHAFEDGHEYNAIFQQDAKSGIIDISHEQRFSKQLRLLLGTLIERTVGYQEVVQAGQFFRGIPTNSLNSFGGYAELTYKPWDPLNLTGGFQINETNTGQFKTVPRLALTSKLTKNISVKLLAGQGFRAPTFFELYYNLAAGKFIPNPNLAAEIATTYEAQLFFHGNFYEASLAYFDSHYTGGITKITFPDGTQQYQNAGNSVLRGTELEWKVGSISHFQFIGNMSAFYSIANGMIDTAAPRFSAKSGVAYKFDFGMDLALWNTFYGAATPLPVAHTGFNPPSDAFNWLAGNITFDLNKVFHKRLGEKARLRFQGTNLLNEKSWFPEINVGLVNTIPARPGATGYVEFLYGF